MITLPLPPLPLLHPRLCLLYHCFLPFLTLFLLFVFSFFGYTAFSSSAVAYSVSSYSFVFVSLFIDYYALGNFAFGFLISLLLSPLLYLLLLPLHSLHPPFRCLSLLKVFTNLSIDLSSFLE